MNHGILKLKRILGILWFSPHIFQTKKKGSRKSKIFAYSLVATWFLIRDPMTPQATELISEQQQNTFKTNSHMHIYILAHAHVHISIHRPTWNCIHRWGFCFIQILLMLEVILQSRNVNLVMEIQLWTYLTRLPSSFCSYRGEEANSRHHKADLMTVCSVEWPKKHRNAA